MASFTVERNVSLPVERVWSLIGDFSQSPGPDVEVKIVRDGDSSQHGAGAVRTIKIGKLRVKEILESAKPPHSFRYRIIGNPLMKEYAGNVEFHENEGSTRIRWQGDLRPMIPFTGPICVMVSKGAISKLIDSLEKNNM